MLQGGAVWCSVFQCVAVCCCVCFLIDLCLSSLIVCAEWGPKELALMVVNVVQCGAGWCNVLRCVAVCCCVCCFKDLPLQSDHVGTMGLQRISPHGR